MANGLTYQEELELKDRQKDIDIAYNSVCHRNKRRLRDLQSSIKYYLKLKTNKNESTNQSKI